MPKFEGTEQRTFTVKADLAKVAEVMSDPMVFSRFVLDLETIEPTEDGAYHWRLKEISEKGIHFKGDYKVTYTRDGDKSVSWETIGEGNMSSTGRALFKAVAAGTEVNYTETITTEMDVNRLLAKVIKPIVNRQIARGVGDYLDRVKAHLES